MHEIEDEIAVIALKQPSVLSHTPKHQCRSAIEVWRPDCPQCGDQDLRMFPYDIGTCSQTGYHDAGERWECRTCGAVSDGEELEMQRGGGRTPTTLRGDGERHLGLGDEEEDYTAL